MDGNDTVEEAGQGTRRPARRQPREGEKRRGGTDVRDVRRAAPTALGSPLGVGSKEERGACDN